MQSNANNFRLDHVAQEGGGHGMGSWRAPEMQHWKADMVAWLLKKLNVK
jgi:hypothetical protein